MNRVLALMFRLTNNFFSLLPTLLIVLLTASAVSAETLSVRASGRALKKALARAKRGDTLELASGKYNGKFVVPPGVTLIAKERHKAILQGNGASRVVKLTHNTTLSGIAVTRGQVGIFSVGLQNSIVECAVYRNSQSGVSSLTSFKIFEDNLIYRNGGSGIQIWGLSSTDTISLKHNTIVHNHNHGVSIGGESNVFLENNIIAFNHRLTVRVIDSANVKQEYNNYYSNIEINALLPENNYSFDPMFKAPERDNFFLRKESHCYNNGSEGSNIGSRILTNN